MTFTVQDFFVYFAFFEEKPYKTMFVYSSLTRDFPAKLYTMITKCNVEIYLGQQRVVFQRVENIFWTFHNVFTHQLQPQALPSSLTVFQQISEKLLWFRCRRSFYVGKGSSAKILQEGNVYSKKPQSFLPMLIFGR